MSEYRWWQVGAHPRLWGWIRRVHERGGWRWRVFLVVAAPVLVLEWVASPVVSRIWRAKGAAR